MLNLKWMSLTHLLSYTCLISGQKISVLEIWQIELAYAYSILVVQIAIRLTKQATP